MDDRVSADTEAMLNAGQGLSQLQAGLANVVSDLEGRLGAIGPAWGPDEAGATFEQGYRPALDSLLNGVHGSAGVAGSAYDGVVTTARGFAGTEEENQASIHLSGNGASEGSSGSPRGPRG